MIVNILKGLVVAATLIGGFFIVEPSYTSVEKPRVEFVEYKPTNVGAFSDPFLSIQLATNPSNGNCLTTDGTNNSWSASCGSGGGDFPFTPTTNYGINVNSTTSPIWFRDQIFGSSSAIIAGTVTASNFIATSTTATSTFSGDVNITGSGTTNLSIGTDSVAGARGARLEFKNANNGGNDSCGITDYISNSTVNPARIDCFLNTSGSTASLRFFTSTSGSAGLTERLRIIPTGEIGIGTTTPTQRISSVDNISWGANNEGLVSWSTNNGATGNGSASLRATQGRDLKLQSNNGNSEISLTSAGNVGIGTTTPNAQLTINGAGQTTSAMDTEAGNLGGTLKLQDTGAAVGNGGAACFGLRSGAAQKTFGCIKGLGTNSGGNSVGDIAISTRSGTADSTLTERLMIKGGVGGNVGISSSSPLARLSVAGAGTGTGLTFQTTNSSETPLITAYDNGNTFIGSTTPFLATQSKVEIYGTGVSTYGAGLVVNETVSSGCPIGATGATGYYGYFCSNTGGGSNLGFRIHMGETIAGRRALDISNSNETFFSADGNARIGVGSTTPNAKLTVESDGVSTNLAVDVADSNGTSILRVIDNGSIGINTESCSSPLCIGRRAGGGQIDFSINNVITTVNGSDITYTPVPTGVRSGGHVFYFVPSGGGTARLGASLSNSGTFGVGTSTASYAALGVSNRLTTVPVAVFDALSGTSVNILDVKLASTTAFSVNSSGNTTVANTFQGSGSGYFNTNLVVGQSTVTQSGIASGGIETRAGSSNFNTYPLGLINANTGAKASIGQAFGLADTGGSLSRAASVIVDKLSPWTDGDEDGRYNIMVANNGTLATSTVITTIGLGVGTSTPVATINSYTSASTTNMLLEAVSDRGGCLMMKDVQGAGYTQIYTQGGAILSKVATSLSTCN